jgi:hypothetical protein
MSNASPRRGEPQMIFQTDSSRPKTIEQIVPSAQKAEAEARGIREAVVEPERGQSQRQLPQRKPRQLSGGENSGCHRARWRAGDLLVATTGAGRLARRSVLKRSDVQAQFGTSMLFISTTSASSGTVHTARDVWAKCVRSFADVLRAAVLPATEALRRRSIPDPQVQVHCFEGTPPAP